MKAIVKKWGNSLGLRLPKALSQQLQIEENATVEMEVLQGRLVVTLVPAEESLEDLVARITPENRHEETDWGEALGTESW